MPPCSALSWSQPSSQGAWFESYASGSPPFPSSSVGSVMDDKSLAQEWERACLKTDDRKYFAAEIILEILLK